MNRSQYLDNPGREPGGTFVCFDVQAGSTPKLRCYVQTSVHPASVAGLPRYAQTSATGAQVRFRTGARAGNYCAGGWIFDDGGAPWLRCNARCWCDIPTCGNMSGSEVPLPRMPAACIGPTNRPNRHCRERKCGTWSGGDVAVSRVPSVRAGGLPRYTTTLTSAS